MVLVYSPAITKVEMGKVSILLYVVIKTFIQYLEDQTSANQKLFFAKFLKIEPA